MITLKQSNVTILMTLLLLVMFYSFIFLDMDKFIGTGISKRRVYLFSSPPSSENTKYTRTMRQPLYVTINRRGRLGNQMFEYAVLRAVSHDKPWIPLLSKSFDHLREAFNISLKWTNMKVENATTFIDNRTDPRGTLRRLKTNLPKNRNISLNGFFQSYRYFENVMEIIRKEFTFNNKIKKKSERILLQAIPNSWKNMTFTRVGIHVRRRDLLKIRIQKNGYNFPTISYFSNAMDYFLNDNAARVQFIVASDDIKWCWKHLNLSKPRSQIYFLERNEAPVDMAVLTSCDHVVTTMGTFSWWTGWLCKGKCIYYKYFPRPGSKENLVYPPGYYYPPTWIPME